MKTFPKAPLLPIWLERPQDTPQKNMWQNNVTFYLYIIKFETVIMGRSIVQKTEQRVLKNVINVGQTPNTFYLNRHLAVRILIHI